MGPLSLADYKPEDVWAFYVYVAFVDGYVKVGYSKDPLERAKEVQTGCPLPLQSMILYGFDGRLPACRAELWSHRKLRRLHTCGEWFKIEDREAILAVVHRVATRINPDPTCGPIPMDLTFVQRAEEKRARLERGSRPKPPKPKRKRPIYGPPAPKPEFVAPEPVRRRLFQRH